MACGKWQFDIIFQTQIQFPFFCEITKLVYFLPMSIGKKQNWKVYPSPVYINIMLRTRSKPKMQTPK